MYSDYNTIMSKRKNSELHKLRGNKDIFQKPSQHDEEVKGKKNGINTYSSPKNCNIKTYDIPGHSTPFQTKSTNDIEGSPEPDYRCSPILIPCTQDFNEVAWDWHSSINKPSDKEKIDGNQASTPKRTTLLQKKRNSNSPLLYQPFRRKLVKADNIESIGKFAAELKALTEKMKTIQRNEEDNFVNEEDNNEDKVEDLFEEDKADVRIALNGNTSNLASTSINKMSVSLEELFDESIEDSMVRCSQEIEEKFNLCSSKESSASHSSNGSGDKIMRANSSSENSRNSLFSQNSPILNVSSFCKTYSKPTPKKNVNINANIFEKREETETMKKPLNNNTANVYNGNLQARKKSARKSSSELFEIPDDSFDDCLATCIEDEKLIPESTEYDDIFADRDHKLHKDDKNSKQPNLSNNKYFPKNTTKTSTDLDTSNRLVVNTNASGSVTESRKFFKTRSLSDSYFGQEKGMGPNNKATVSNSRQIAKFSSHSNLPTKLQTNANDKNTVNGNVYTNKNIKSVNGKESVYSLSNSKIISKDSGCITSKSNSMNGESQVMRCTPEEIERKRLEAKMRLEAKRKMPVNAMKKNSSEIPVKRVQR